MGFQIPLWEMMCLDAPPSTKNILERGKMSNNQFPTQKGMFDTCVCVCVCAFFPSTLLILVRIAVCVVVCVVVCNVVCLLVSFVVFCCRCLAVAWLGQAVLCRIGLGVPDAVA